MTMKKNLSVAVAAVAVLAGVSAYAAPYNSTNAAWNVNFNPNGADPSQYYGSWPGHTYQPSPADWRDVPIYQFITDRFIDGNPRNNEGAFGGYDLGSVYYRHGGDFTGVKERLPYVKSLGYKGIWVSPIFQNMENSYHGYAQIDFTRLDDRFGTVEEFRAMVNRAHELGMYVIVDIVVNHMADLLYFEGYQNADAPFKLHNEYRLFPYDASRTYEDFWINNTYYASGNFPAVYDSDGWRITDSYGLYGSYWFSDFHHNGDLFNYGDPWQNHLGKIYGLMDDLRTTHPRVQDKIIAMTKALITSTDIDGIRMDTPMQVPLYFFQRWAPAVKAHAASLGKDNFLIFGEFFCTRGRAATMTGRGKDPTMWGTTAFIGSEFTMDGGINYPAYWSFFQNALKNQADGNLNQLKENYNLDWLAFDFYDPVRRVQRYLHFNFYDNHDQWRMAASAADGFQKTDLGSAILAFWPGVPLFYYGDEQGLCSYGTALDGWAREDFMTSLAWNNVGSAASPNPAKIDNFDMTNPHYLYVQKAMNVRRQYPALSRGDTIYERWAQPNNGNGIYAYTRAHNANPDEFALVAFNTWKQTLTAGGSMGNFYTGWAQGDVIANALIPSETYTLGANGTLPQLWVTPYECKVFVKQSQLKTLDPVVTACTPRHDSRVGGAQTISLTFSEPMDEASVKANFRYDGQAVDGLVYNAGTRTLAYAVTPTDGLHYVNVLEGARSLAGRTLFGEFRSRFRVGSDQNVICQPSATWDTSLIANGAATTSSSDVTLNHKAVGATLFRVQNGTGAWSAWQNYAPTSTWNLGGGTGTKQCTVQYWADGSAAYYVTDTIEVVAAPPAVTSLGLVNADTDQPIAGFYPLANNAVLDLDTLGTTNLNVVAQTAGGTGSVRFGYDAAANYSTDNAAPYALAGDTAGNYAAWTPALGAHAVAATPYSGANATGTGGTTYTLAFSVVRQDSDGDGMPDAWENAYGLNAGSSGDAGGDLDNDGLANLGEFQRGTRPNAADSDGDGMPDGYEVAKSFNPLSNDAGGDADGDSLTNVREYQLGTNPRAADSDGDGMPDAWEVNNGLNPLANDAAGNPDNDGYTNVQEYQNGTNPRVADPFRSSHNAMAAVGTFNGWAPSLTNMVLVADYTWQATLKLTNAAGVQFKFAANGSWAINWGETDQTDRDMPLQGGFAEQGNFPNIFVNGTLTGEYIFKLNTQTRAYSVEKVSLPDADGDGMPDAWETANGLNPNSAADAAADPDGDALSNLNEYVNRTNPKVADTDADGMPDGYEVSKSFDPLVNDGGGDADADGLLNRREYQLGTNPRAADTDGDGMPDGWETTYALNPLANDAAGNPDGDAFTNLQEYQNGTNPTVFDAARPKSSYSNMTATGTFNGWNPGLKNMKLIADYTWQVKLTLTNQTAVQFKFVANGSWAVNWGESNQGDLDLPLEGNIAEGGDQPNVRINGTLTGTYVFTFNEQTRAYTVALDVGADTDNDGMPDAWESANGLNPNNPADAAGNLDGDGYTNLQEYKNGTNPRVADPFRSAFASMTVAGTFNGWNAALNNMALVADYTWRTTVSLANATGVQFKFTANGAWISNWGETNQSDFDLPLAGNFAEMGNFPNIRINGTVNGTLRVTFNELTSSYTAELL